MTEIVLTTIFLLGELAFCGHQVKVWDCDRTKLDSLPEQLAYDREQLVQNGLMVTPPLGEVSIFSNLQEALMGASIVIEAVLEDQTVKKELMKKVCEDVEDSTIVVTSTLRLSPEEIFQEVSVPERTLGVRFLFPVYSIPEVELRPWSKTDKATLGSITGWLERLGKTAFLRSGPEPLVLSEAEREERWNRRAALLRSSRGLTGLTSHLPLLAHRGNFAPPQDDETRWTKRISVEQECIICMDCERDCLLAPCHHLATCQACGDLLIHRGDCCPVCRNSIKQIIKFYRS